MTGTVNCKHKAGIFCCFRITSVVILFLMASQTFLLRILSQNLTSHVQLNNASIIHCFKAHYHGKFIARAIDQYDNKVVPSKIYDIDQLKAMRLVKLAWNQVDMTTIWNYWRNSHHLPPQFTGPSRSHHLC